MQSIINLVGLAPGYLLFIVSVLIFTAIGFAIRYIIGRYISNKLSFDFARVIVGNLSTGLIFWSLMGGVDFGLRFLKLGEDTIKLIDQGIFIAVAVSITLVVAYILGDTLKMWGEKFAPHTTVTGLGQFSLKLIVLIIGLLVILGTLGIQVSPVLASLGIAGLAVALAMQSTLANIFAGIYIMAERPVRVGDFIKLESGEEGFVTDVTWRSTWIRMLPNNTVIIPNQKLADSVVLNYYYPEQRLALLMEIKVSYEDDPQKVEEILVDEMVKSSFEVDGMVTAYEMRPFVRFIPGYEDYSMNFTTICQVREVIDRYYIQHELRKRIWDRFKKEGITIPFPIRTLHFPQKYMNGLNELEFFGEGKNE